MNENYVKDQTEIDLAQLFWAICRRWRMVLCWMLAVAVVAGAFKAVSTARSLRNTEEIAAAQSTYEALVANNRQERSDILKRLRSISEEIAEQQAYEKNSYYMSIDPYNVAVAEQIYYVKTDYQILPDMIYQNPDYTDAIVNAYMYVLTGESNLQPVAEKCDMELRYLEELVTVWSNGSGMFTVHVIARDMEEAEKILALLDGGVATSRELIESTINAHEITKLTYNAYTTVDMNLSQTQSDKEDALTKLRTEYADQTARYETLKEDYKNFKAPVSDTDGVLRGSVKMIVLGALLGAVIACCIVCVQAAVSDRLYSAGSLTQRVCLRILGAVPTDPAKISAMGKLDRKLRGKAGLSTATDAAGVYAAAASYLAGAYPEANTVLVAGGAEEEHIQAVCEAFQANLPEKKFLPGGSVLTDADTIRKVGQSDLTVLVEHTGVSSYSGVIREAETVQSLKGTLAGALVIED